MNHLVFLDSQAGELEKILSGVKRMILKEFDPTELTAYPVNPGDRLYFLRDKGEDALRVEATVVRVLPFMQDLDSDLSRTIKEMQPRLQLTEDQYNYWSVKKQALLVEFCSAHKIPVIQVDSNKISDRSDWIPFEEFDWITE
jgi:hypothetical protein